MKVATVFGTRPEAIKMMPVIRELKAHAEQIEPLVIVTGQHKQMLEQMLQQLSIVPDYNLDVMEPGQTLATITTKILGGLDKIFESERPDVVLVQGDTASTFVASLTAFYHKISVGHIEAGLRSYEKYSPFPEEVNRRLVSVLADFHFAPTEKAKQNLLSEGIAPEQVFVTGNTSIDALRLIADEPAIFEHPILSNINFDGRRVILVTAHRRENLGVPLKQICHAVKRLALDFNDVAVVFPVHLNPRVREPVQEILGNVERIYLTEPLDYIQFVHLMRRCHLVLTDSGGLQEEAPAFGKPVLVLRDVTERTEALELGTIKLVGTGEERIVATATELLNNPKAYSQMVNSFNPYGDGHAAERIVPILLENISKMSYMIQ